MTERGELPGIQYLVLDKNKILFEYNSGWQDIKNRVPVTNATTFMLNSSTKPVTSAAILQLVDKGKINLDSTLSSYYQNHPYGDQVTIRHLLTHTGGIADPVPINWFHLAEEHKKFDENGALADVLRRSKLKSPPGEKYRYSNIGYWLLGNVIKTASGMSYPDYMKKHILQPLLIPEKEMDFQIPNRDLQAKDYQKKFSLFNLITYIMGDNRIRGKSEGIWSRYKYIYHNGYSYGGLYANALGISRFLQDMLKDKPVIFSPKSKLDFFSPHKTTKGELSGTTPGWSTGELSGVQYFGKPGGGRGSNSNIRIYPDKGLATVFLANKVEISESPINKFSDSLDQSFVIS